MLFISSIRLQPKEHLSVGDGVISQKQDHILLMSDQQQYHCTIMPSETNTAFSKQTNNVFVIKADEPVVLSYNNMGGAGLGEAALLNETNTATI